MSAIGFWYESDGYDTSGKRLVGRQAAGEAFLRALFRHGRHDDLRCVAPKEEDFRDCIERVRSWSKPSQTLRWIPAGLTEEIGEAGVLYRPDPGLGDLAWQRRFVGQRAFSLCGVTHTICTRSVMEYFAALAIAPLQSWDALVCTSQAVRTAADHVLGNWCDYLASRTGGRPKVQIQLPIIPLGIDAPHFAACRKNLTVRQALRATLQIGADDLVILYVGRLNFYAKAHPVPMYLAVERAARAAGRKLHLVQMGWFESQREEQASREAAGQLCPSVQCVFLDGRLPAIREQAWAAADLFVSLSDNIQETFGLTPLEAMAAGLPVVVSDWDGYRDTVRHEVDGFRVPVVMPPAGCGEDLARDFYNGRLAYNSYIGRVSNSTAVEIDAVTRALVTLITNPALRATMAAAGQARAQNEFDYPHIMRRYEALWDELNHRRQADEELAPPPSGGPAHPLADDPFLVFAHYTDSYLHDDLVLTLGPCSSDQMLALTLGTWMGQLGSERRLPQEPRATILAQLITGGPCRLADLQAATPAAGADPARHRSDFLRTIGWLLKFDVVRIVPKPGA